MKVIKLKNILGKDLFVYDERYQTNPEMYPSLIETSGTSKYVILDGKYTTTFIKELNYVPTTCSVYLKIKFNDFTQKTRSISEDHPLTTLKEILPLAKELLKGVDLTNHPIRLLGLSVSNPWEEIDSRGYKQLSFKFK